MISAVLAADVIPARSQMGASLGFHIIFACFGIAFPTVILLADWLGICRGDATSLLLACPWSELLAVFLAVGAVSGMVLPCDLALLWTRLTGRFGAASCICLRLEGIW